MKREFIGVLGREKEQPVLRGEDGKARLVYNILDGFAGKKIKITVEEVEEKW
ncbi:MAG: hypothetical protein AABX40_00925 [Candidatus Hydrothermarchaeota archaeon]